MASKKLYVELAFDIGTVLWQNDLSVTGITGPTGDQAMADVLSAVCDTLKRDNPRFDRDRFITAISERIAYLYDRGGQE